MVKSRLIDDLQIVFHGVSGHANDQHRPYGCCFPPSRFRFSDPAGGDQTADAGKFDIHKYRPGRKLRRQLHALFAVIHGLTAIAGIFQDIQQQTPGGRVVFNNQNICRLSHRRLHNCFRPALRISFVRGGAQTSCQLAAKNRSIFSSRRGKFTGLVS
ncbi:hypothetical protein HCH_04266 [Hahella chejuensis KCTC 2396]|uniref:Uncharacterized protein n=1 Tax=Hahella chejuensis (strain KCTC 2396) TaxID=349521 RepID=Q2SEF2_HAHCH|nr:hypothetical protein HCH_04266 [Hahella chejuensis KCTC 2396]